MDVPKHKSPEIEEDNETRGNVSMPGSNDNRSTKLGRTLNNKRRALLQTLGSFILFFNTWGIILAFGAFQTYYEQQLLKNESSSTISWIGTISAFLLLLGGATSGKLYDLGFFRYLLIVGSLLIVFGLMMASLATKYYQILLAQGIVVGIGTSLLWIPAMTVVAIAFHGKMRATAIAMGCVSAGSSIGGVVYPIVFRRLQPQIGFPWTVRTMAFLQLGTFAISFAMLLPTTPIKRSKGRHIFDLTAIRDYPYMTFIVSGLFTLLGYYAPLVYLPLYVETSVHGQSSTSLGFYLLAAANGASSISRIGGGFVAAKFGPCATYTAALFCSAILLFTQIAIHSVAGIVVWVILWGLSTGLIISLPGAIVPLLCPNPAVLGTRIGMSFLGGAIGMLIGGPIGGELIYALHASRPTWWPMLVFTGLAMFIGASLNVYVWAHTSAKKRTQQS